jgi:hypothetical protein
VTDSYIPEHDYAIPDQVVPLKNNTASRKPLLLLNRHTGVPEIVIVSDECDTRRNHDVIAG